MSVRLSDGPFRYCRGSASAFDASCWSAANKRSFFVSLIVIRINENARIRLPLQIWPPPPGRARCPAHRRGTWNPSSPTRATSATAPRPRWRPARRPGGPAGRTPTSTPQESVLHPAIIRGVSRDLGTAAINDKNSATNSI